MSEALLPLREAQRRVLALAGPLGLARVPIGEALGHVLGNDVVADEPLPPFANSAMDGYAVRASDTTAPGAVLEVLGTIAAGTAPPPTSLAKAQAYRIMTGAPLPKGADAIAIVERTELRPELQTGPGGPAPASERVRLLDAVGRGDHVRFPGSDVRAGDVVLRAGQLCTPGAIGMLASLGHVEVAVHRRPRVGVLSTGDELVEGPASLEPGQIRDANRHTLLALLARDGAPAVDLGIAADDPTAVRGAIEGALERCDLVLTSGGVSMGDFDEVRRQLVAIADARAGSAEWLQVAIRPAKPLSLASLPRGPGRPAVVVLGLPGNPVSSMVSYELFARPVIRALAGHAEPIRPLLLGLAVEALRRKPDGKLHLVRVMASPNYRGRIEVRLAGGQSSHQLSGIVGANALALLPDGRGVAPGAEVAVLPLEPGW
jgi:molybdopterin molybdotransferase